MTLLSTVVRVALVASAATIAVPSLAMAQGSDPSYGAPRVSAGISTVVPAPAPAPAAAAALPPRSIPSSDASVAGVRVQGTTDAPRPPALAPATVRSGQTLAIVGGAAFLGGLMIGGKAGTAIAVGGLAVGVYGLWLWLN